MADATDPAAGTKPRRIVSSAHLVSDKAAELSEFEFGLIIGYHAFSRWMVRCMAAAGYPELSPLDVLVLHSVNHRDRDKRLADVCFTLNVEDTHLVSYSLKKLAASELVSREKRGKEAWFKTTDKGRAACDAYRQVREECLVESFQTMGLDTKAIGELAGKLRALSGLYGQAARAATVL
ncbi:winged helix DNA-binding protein [Caenispirillum bisanense]|uniref:Predicted transcription regulator, contains HTH domain, MarR family n=1 Tax=Caenispirillum bisanense TaxID=414052 RepID=A0A286G1V6_9PROT|nr:winged helix DNA-binding protein [Caenispirillum bisanense]SOD89473.1 Predicted transcription regulator, contains HTH domain, MarR family [Caenispirillum bisanense]